MKKSEIKTVGTTVNNIKMRIDDLQAQLDGKRASKGPAPAGAEGEVVDEEEYRIIKDISEEKKKYRAAFAQLRDAKGAWREPGETCGFAAGL